MSFFINTLRNLNIECPRIILETGTYLGDGIKSYLETNYFKKIYSIELSNKYYLLNKENFKQNLNVQMLEGDSSEVIKDLVYNKLLEKEPIIFYLDAHYSGGDTAGEFLSNGCPVLQELEVIANRNVTGDIIFVDDMRLMGKAEWSGIDDGGQWPRTFFDFTHASYENILKAIQKRKIKLIKMVENSDRLLIVLDKKSTKVHTIGDSHSINAWANIKDVNVHYLGSKLCYSFGRDGLDISNFNINEGDTVIFSYGEIDCRCHIHKYITPELSYKKIIDDIINNYFCEIKNCTSDFKNLKICVYNVVPPVEKYNTKEYAEYPFLGTDAQRKEYILYFNSKIKEKCNEYGFVFFDIYNKYTDENGFLNKSLSDDNVHIKNECFVRDFLEEII
jgi:hypothetical protein